MTGYPRAYLPPRKFRGRYTRYRRSSGSAGPVIGLAAGVLLASGLGAHAAVTVVRHHQAEHNVPPAAIRSAPVAGGTQTAFIDAVLADLGAPASQANTASLASWFPHEFPSFPPAAAWNPMASTLQMPGSTVYNSVGVQNYTSAAEGAQATALTLADGWYPNILAALRSGRGLCGDPSLAAEFLVWSGNGYPGVC